MNLFLSLLELYRVHPLGATVDYAILLTTRFKEEIENGYESVPAMKIAVQESAKSIVTSGFAFLVRQ